MIKKINNYQILSKIASGGMSEVYLADDIETGKKVALKILDAKLSIDPEYLHRFKKEAAICQQLDHKNIVKILSYGTFEESYYIAYEYIEGITLDKLIRQKDLTITQIEKISIQLLEALSYAHSKSIIHRDIKPSNIIIENKTVKILDFGIAKQELAATVTKSGLFMGSPHYVSPEQIEGHDIDYRSDLYSFGIVLYEMIEGRVPFSADTPWGIIRAHLDKKAPEITKDVPSYLKEVVLKCLSKRKEDRFKSANEIISVIVNKEEIGKRTVIIKNEWEKLEKILEKENSIDEWEGKNTIKRGVLPAVNYEKIRKQDLFEEKFLDNKCSLLNEYNSVANHIKAYGGENLIWAQSNSIEFEWSVLARYQELVKKLRNFSCPSSYENDKNDLIGIAESVCFYQNEIVNNEKSDDYNAYINNFNACYQKISDLFDYYNSMVANHNKKYHW